MRRVNWMMVLGLPVAWLSSSCAGLPSDQDGSGMAEQQLTQSGVTAELNVTSDWGGGYCASILVTNGSDNSVSDWSILLNPNGAMITSLWNGTQTASGANAVLKPASYINSLAPKGSATLGFCAAGAARAKLVSLTAGRSSTGSGGTGGKSGTGGAPAKGGATASGGKATIASGATTGTSTSGGAPNTGGSTSSSGDCSAPPSAPSLVGWAAVSGGGIATTTGGGTATPVTVSTLAALQAAAKGTTASVIYVKGKLAAGSISVGSNKTIVGICGAEIHGHLELSGSVNVIVRNVKIVGYAVGDCSKDPAFDSSEGCSSGADAVTVQNSAHHIWFDHCDVSDGTDGNLDITKASDYVTVSWTKFHYTARTDKVGSDSTGASGHRFSNLVGGSDTEASAGKLNITWHHNWWADNVHERQPQVRFGKNHLYNNLWTSSGNNYCVRAVVDAHLLVENNVFSGVKDPHIFNSGASATSSITASSSKNTYTNTTGNKTTGGSGAVFTPTYAYTPDALSSVESMVRVGVGPR